MLVRRVWPSRPAFERPFPEIGQFRRELLRLYDDLAGGEPWRGALSGVFPPLNVTQDAENFYVRAEVPGIPTSDLSITALQNRISVSGKREIPAEHERVSYHRKERAEGSFSRTVMLPIDIDGERIEARCVDGILTIKLPKAETAKPRQIAVKS